MYTVVAWFSIFRTLLYRPYCIDLIRSFILPLIFLFLVSFTFSTTFFFSHYLLFFSLPSAPTLQVNDKEICLGLVSTSHDQHIGRILKKEDEARSMELACTVELVLRFTSGAWCTRVSIRMKCNKIDKTLSIILCCTIDSLSRSAQFSLYFPQCLVFVMWF